MPEWVNEGPPFIYATEAASPLLPEEVLNWRDEANADRIDESEDLKKVAHQSAFASSGDSNVSGSAVGALAPPVVVEAQLKAKAKATAAP